MLPLRILSGIGIAAAGVLAVATLVSQRPPDSSNSSGGAGPAPQIQFLWSVPGAPASGTPPLRPQIASSGPEEESEAPPPARHSRKHHAAREHHRTKHRHRH